MMETDTVGVLNLLQSEEVNSRAEPELVQGRRILMWSSYCGTYGMGGPGFLGFLLSETEERGEEWLILTLWAADEWCIVDGKPIGAPKELYSEWRPYCSNYADAKWDDFSPLLGVGGFGNKKPEVNFNPVLETFRCGPKSCQITISRGEEKPLVINIHEDPEMRPPWANGTPHVLGESDLRDLWVLANVPNVMI
ncbi:MAG: hypothetical protein PHS86_11405 [Syntrophaceae bacterium]|nr:hypothetical protein [Syntrophaceae bacterium]